MIRQEIFSRYDDIKQIERVVCTKKNKADFVRKILDIRTISGIIAGGTAGYYAFQTLEDVSGIYLVTREDKALLCFLIEDAYYSMEVLAIEPNLIKTEYADLIFERCEEEI